MTEENNYNQIEIISKIDLMKKEIDVLRPIDKEREDKIFQKFRLDWNYNSCVIEGNSLNYGETVTFLMYGLTAKGKPLKDHLDIKGHNEAIRFLLDLVKSRREITESDIRSLHEMILVEPYETDAITTDGLSTKKLVKIGVYKSSPNHVKTLTGETHHYTTPEETPIKMQELMDWYRKYESDSDVHPVILAALFHHKFAAIHPFDDGNGRMARLLMNLILMKFNYPPVVIKKSDKNQYYSCLSQADAGNPLPFIEFICENLIHSMEIYIKGAKGESIDEPDDLDKELALLKQTLAGRDDKIERRRDLSTQTEVYQRGIKTFIINLKTTLSKFKDMFFINEENRILLNQDNKWVYEPIYFGSYSIMKNKMAEVVSPTLEYIVCNNINFNFITISFSFSEFKYQNIQFGFEIKLNFEFDEFKYRISYSISEFHELKNKNADLYKIKNWNLLVDNYYNQYLTDSEIQNFSNRIGNESLSYIKARIDNLK
jgi:Fic family protein